MWKNNMGNQEENTQNPNILKAKQQCKSVWQD